MVMLMARVWYLDRTFDLNTEYRFDKRLGAVVKLIGTNVADEVTLYVDNKPLIPIHGDMAPINFLDSNMLGMLDLKDLYFVIPPDTPFEFESASSGKVRVKGELWILEPKEDLPSEYYRRLQEAYYKGISYYRNVVTLAADQAFATTDEITLATIEPAKLEKYTLNDIVMIKLENTANPLDYGQVSILFYIDDQPVEFITDNNPKRGIDIMDFPYPPSQDNGWYPFTLKDTPVELTEGHKLKITAINISGADIAPPSGGSLSFTAFVKMIYEKSPMATGF